MNKREAHPRLLTATRRPAPPTPMTPGLMLKLSLRELSEHNAPSTATTAASARSACEAWVTHEEGVSFRNVTGCA